MQDDVMTSEHVRTILFASLATAVILSSSAMGLAYAELSEEIKQKALEGKQIWERIDELQNKADQTDTERLEVMVLQTDFDAIAAELNLHGIATPEQWEANADYWITASILVIPDEDHQIENGTGAASCGCSQTLWFVPGYTYWLWEFWPTSAYGDWESLRNEGDWRTSTVTTEDDHDKIQPFTTFTLSTLGVAEATLGMYGETEDGVFFWNAEDRNVRTTSVNPFHTTVKESTIESVVKDSDIVAKVTLNSIQ